MKDLIDIENTSKEDILKLINIAKEFKLGAKKSDVEGKTVALMFCENSTRTRCSFEIAAKKLKLNVINFDSEHSSLKKGESFKDTLENLYFLGTNAVVIRHSMSGILNNILKSINYPLSLINAGDGMHAHPTQALLDLYTMKERLGSVEGKKITIVGDIAHSRVAKSNIKLLKKFNADVHICSPSYLAFEDTKAYDVTYHECLAEAIDSADVVMALRVQNERHENSCYPKTSEYSRLYSLNSKILEKYAPNAILMHPGPVNVNVEISSELLESPKGKTILEQAKNGVFVRMALLNTILQGSEA